MSEPFKIGDIKFDNIHYTETKENKDIKIIKLKYKKNNSLKKMVIQTPTLLCNNKFISSGNHYYVDIPLITKNDNKRKQFIDFLEQFDNKVLYDGNINSSSWFNSEEINFKKTIRQNNNDEYIKLKILNNLEFNTILQLNNSKRINYEEIPERSWIKMILEFNSVIINKNSFGLYIKPILISFEPIEIPKYTLIEDSDNDEVEELGEMFNDTEIFIKSTNTKNDMLESTALQLPTELDLSEKDFSSTSSDNIDQLKSSK